MSETFYQRIEAYGRAHHVDVRKVCLGLGISFNDLEQWIRGSLPCLEDLDRLCSALHIGPMDILTKSELDSIKSGNTEACRILGRQTKYAMDAQTMINSQYLLLDSEPGKQAYIRAVVELILSHGSKAQISALFEAASDIMTEVMEHKLQL